MTKVKLIRQNANFLKIELVSQVKARHVGIRLSLANALPHKVCGCPSGLWDCECEVLKNQFGSEGPPEGWLFCKPLALPLGC